MITAVDGIRRRFLRNPVSQNARALVTGAGSGIGRAFALELGRRGGEVICADIDETRADETASLVTSRTGRVAHAFTCDVADQAAMASLAAFTRDTFDGPPTLVVNNAGVGVGGRPVGDIGFDDWDWTLGINLWGVVHGCELFAPMLREAAAAGSSTSRRPRVSPRRR